MAVMTASEEVKELVAVESLVHWDGENILVGVFIVYTEVACIVTFECISGFGYLVTTSNTCLQRFEFLSVNIESQRVIMKINFMIEQDFSHQKVSHGSRETAIIVAFVIAVCIGQIGNCG